YERWPYGYGIGTVSLGTQYIAKFFHAKPPVIGVESGFGALIVEMGIGGLLLWFVMSFAIILSAWRVVTRLRGSPWFPIAFVIFWYAGLLLIPITYGGMQGYQDYVMNVLLLSTIARFIFMPSESRGCPSIHTVREPPEKRTESCGIRYRRSPNLLCCSFFPGCS